MLIKNNLIQIIKILTIAIVMGFSVNFLYAQWTDPEGLPPNYENIPPPLNQSSVDQKKKGNLEVNAFEVANGDALFGPCPGNEPCLKTCPIGGPPCSGTTADHAFDSNVLIDGYLSTAAGVSSPDVQAALGLTASIAQKDHFAFYVNATGAAPDDEKTVISGTVALTEPDDIPGTVSRLCVKPNTSSTDPKEIPGRLYPCDGGLITIMANHFNTGSEIFAYTNDKIILTASQSVDWSVISPRGSVGPTPAVATTYTAETASWYYNNTGLYGNKNMTIDPVSVEGNGVPIVVNVIHGYEVFDSSTTTTVEALTGGPGISKIYVQAWGPGGDGGMGWNGCVGPGGGFGGPGGGGGEAGELDEGAFDVYPNDTLNITVGDVSGVDTVVLIKGVEELRGRSGQDGADATNIGGGEGGGPSPAIYDINSCAYVSGDVHDGERGVDPEDYAGGPNNSKIVDGGRGGNTCQDQGGEEQGGEEHEGTPGVFDVLSFSAGEGGKGGYGGSCGAYNTPNPASGPGQEGGPTLGQPGKVIVWW